MVYGKLSKRLPTLRRPTLSKKEQDKKDVIKKPYDANKWLNDRKLQLHWNKTKWVNTRSQTKRNKTLFSFINNVLLE